jgi:hypothetical protein
MARINVALFLAVILVGVTFLIPAAAAVHEAAQSARPPDPRFGAIETYDAPGAASEIGAAWTRVPFLWANMQPNGSEDWIPPLSDEVLASELAQGRQLVGLIITTPSWATDSGVGPGVPRGLHTGHNDPGNLWAAFIRRLVTTYSGRIDNWIIWNEPDVWDSAHPGYTWGGSVDDFLQLQRVAYMSAKEANPNTTIIFSGTSYWWDVAYGRDLYFRRYLDALIRDSNAPGNSYYCDVVALHVYFQPDFVYSITALYHQLMRERGFDKPIWIVETNAAPSLDPNMPVPNSQFAITLDEQAAYIVQAFAMGIAGGASRLSVFKMIDTPTDLTANPEPFGLVRADGSRRPAFNTYRVAATYMAGFQGGRLEQTPELSIVTIPRNSGTTTVLWARTPAPTSAVLPANVSTATLVDMWGNRRTIAASEGFYSVSLPGAICTHGSPCIIGGAPFLIVEGGIDSPAPPAQAPPALPGEADENNSSESTDTDSTGQVDRDVIENTVEITPTATPGYGVNLRPIEIDGAQDIWHKRGLPGYEIELIAGPPFHLYRLTVLDEAIVQARRSSKPLTIDLDDLDTLTDHAPITTTMTTLYNRMVLEPFTIEGLFERVKQYYEQHPTVPACDTQVTVSLNGDWAFPKRIIEEWADGCPAEGSSPWLVVTGFATLTPTPTTIPTATATAAPTNTSAPTATARASMTPPARSSSTPVTSPTPTPGAATDQRNLPIWAILLTGIAVTAIAFYLWKARN